MTQKSIYLILLLIAGFFFGCEDPVPEPEPVQVSEKTLKINTFIEDVMGDVYLWEEEMPEIDIRYEFNSKKYFDKLLYEDDRWSMLTDDIQGLLDSFEGVETSFGYSLARGTFSNTGNNFAVVLFVYPNTPADRAGLKRGDIIMLINGGDITADNYGDLFDAPQLNISLGILGPQGISVNPDQITMTAQKLNLNPVMTTKVVEHAGHKIGYLFYAQYITNYNSSLDTAFQFFLDEGITDLVLDLRYNPGGYLDAAQYLCSSVAPLDPVFAKKTLVTLKWNDYYQDYWSKNNQSQLKATFINYNQVKLGLNELYVLTGSGTASASELTITGLKPYMDVITVGDTTVGKYTASTTFLPEDIYDEEAYYEEFIKWGIQPIICRYANSLGVTDFKDGFAPDILVEDDLFAGIPLGDPQDPLFRAAIEDITGEVLALKKARAPIPYTLIDSRFSKYGKLKENLILDNFDPKLLFD